MSSYKHGPLIEICLDFVGERDRNVDVRNALGPRGKNSSKFPKLSGFLKGRKVFNAEPHPEAKRLTRDGRRRERIIEEVIMTGAAEYMFPWKEGGFISIQASFIYLLCGVGRCLPPFFRARVCVSGSFCEPRY